MKITGIEIDGKIYTPTKDNNYYMLNPCIGCELKKDFCVPVICNKLILKNKVWELRK